MGRQFLPFDAIQPPPQRQQTALEVLPNPQLGTAALLRLVAEQMPI